MRLHRLRLVNFRQHEDTDLRFDEGLTGVVGPNGSGKTTLIEALAWALYGARAARGTSESIRRRTAPPRARVEVTVEFALGPHRYLVVRGLHGAALYMDGGTTPIADGVTAVTERLTRLLGMTREEFFNTYFTSQKQLVILAAMPPLDREKFLSRVLGYERLALVQKRLKVEASELRARVLALESTMPQPAELARQEAEAGAQLERAEQAVEAAERLLAETEAALARERPAWEALERLQDEVRALESDLRVAEQQVQNARTALARLERELAETRAARDRLVELEPLLAPLPALLAERARLDALAARMAHRQEVVGQQRELRERLAVLERRLAELPPPDRLAAARAALGDTQRHLQQVEADADERHTGWVRDLQDARTKRQQLLDQYQDLTRQVELLRAAGAEGSCPTCGRPLAAELPDVLAELERQREEIRFNGNFYRQRIEQLEREPPELIEARRQVEACKAERERLAEELARLEAAAQHRRVLTSDREALVARLDALAATLAEVGDAYDAARHAAVVNELARLDPVRVEVERLRVHAERAADLAAQAVEAKAELSQREAQVQDLQHRLQHSGWSAETYAAARARITEAEQARHRAEVVAIRAAAERDAARTAVETVAARRAEREARAAEVRDLTARLVLVQELDRAVADLRGDLTASLRPDLSELGSRFVRDLTGGRYAEFELDEEYAPVIIEDGEPQTVLSGGEEDVVNLALRLAISQMIAERAGQPLSLLVLDEIFGSLDEERRGAVVDLLRRLADRFPQVILITHIETVREGFDRILRLSYDVERGVARVTEEPLAGHDVAA